MGSQAGRALGPGCPWGAAACMLRCRCGAASGGKRARVPPRRCTALPQSCTATRPAGQVKQGAGGMRGPRGPPQRAQRSTAPHHRQRRNSARSGGSDVSTAHPPTCTQSPAQAHPDHAGLLLRRLKELLHRVGPVAHWVLAPAAAARKCNPPAVNTEHVGPACRAALCGLL